MFSDYKIAKWSRIVRIRDNHTCVMCKESAETRSDIHAMHAHHIDRQVDKPELAVNLNNGVCLCANCHLAIVHSTHKNHRQFRVIFKRWVRRKANREFEEKYQYKLSG